MRKFWVYGLILLLACSCAENKKDNQESTVKKTEEKPIETKYGFNVEQYTIVNDTVKNGDSFGELMLKNAVDYDKVVHIANNFKDTFDVRKIKVGKPYTIFKSKDTLQKAEVFVYENDRINYTVVDLRDTAIAYKKQKKVTTLEREVAGVIKNSLSVDMDSLGVDYVVALKLSEIYAWTVDFFKLEKGDKFKLVFEQRYINDSIYAGIGDIKAAFFEHKGKPIYAFPFAVDSLKNQKDYYDQEANSLRSTFLKAPIKFGYRLSSRFNLKRRIAYYGYKIRPHRGTDYAAPIGTPIVATADGTVTESTRRGGNGKYVKIKHNGMYSTQYLHMKAQNVRKGDYVRQGDVIGWVGMTGNTGGPHVCYRFWKNGVQVDPLRQKLPSAEAIKDSLKPDYFEFIKPLQFQLDCIPYANIKEEQKKIQNQQNDITKNQSYNHQSLASVN